MPKEKNWRRFSAISPKSHKGKSGRMHRDIYEYQGDGSKPKKRKLWD